MISNELILEEEDKAFKIIQALSSETSFRILKLLANESLDVSTIAKRLGVSEPYVSEEIKTFEKLDLIKVTYVPGKRGIKKVCELKMYKIIIYLKKDIEKV